MHWIWFAFKINTIPKVQMCALLLTSCWQRWEVEVTLGTFSKFPRSFGGHIASWRSDVKPLWEPWGSPATCVLQRKSWKLQLLSREALPETSSKVCLLVWFEWDSWRASSWFLGWVKEWWRCEGRNLDSCLPQCPELLWHSYENTPSPCKLKQEALWLHRHAERFLDYKNTKLWWKPTAKSSLKSH